jgi:hypothetical protein
MLLLDYQNVLIESLLKDRFAPGYFSHPTNPFTYDQTDTMAF